MWRLGWLLLVGVLGGREALSASPVEWKALAPGVELAELSPLTVVRIDPEKRPLRLLSAKALHLPDNLTVEQWATKYGLLAVTNAGMFEQDHRTPTGYAKVADRVLNPRWKRNYQALLVMDPKWRCRASG